jgi:hypothetical protein
VGKSQNKTSENTVSAEVNVISKKLPFPKEEISLAVWILLLKDIQKNSNDKTEDSFFRGRAAVYEWPFPIFNTTNSQTTDKHTENNILSWNCSLIKCDSSEEDSPSLYYEKLTFNTRNTLLSNRKLFKNDQQPNKQIAK